MRDILDKIKSKIDMVDLVREYVPRLRKAGKNHVALCPFHDEKTPSFNVSPDKQIFYCFGCHEHGDIFTFVMKIENVSFIEAAKKLADKAGVSGFSSFYKSSSKEDKIRAEMKKALSFAAERYKKFLTSSNARSAARYLESRSLSGKTIAEFDIGFAPPESDFIIAEAGKAGISKEILVKSGIASIKDNGHVSDYMRNRVTFPIKNPSGEVIAFGGRMISSGEPKYLNTPETILFSKRKNFYGLNRALAQIRQVRKILVVEGYIDVIMAHQCGLTLAVAPLGTSLTHDQARLAKRFADEIIIMFDSDPAGRKASIKTGNLFLEEGLYPRVVSLPKGMDPDDFIKERGAEGAIKAIKNSPDLMRFMLNICVERGADRLPLLEKTKMINSLLETLSRQENDIIRMEWRREISEKLNVSEEALATEFSKTARKPAPAPPGGEAEPDVPSIEKGLLQLLLKNPKMVKHCAGVSPEMFKSAFGKTIFSHMKNASRSKPETLSEISKLYPEFYGYALKLSIEDFDGDENVDSSVRKAADLLVKISQQERWKELKNRLDELNAGEMKEFNELTRKKTQTGEQK